MFLLNRRAKPTTPELRGIWLTNTDSKILHSRSRIEAGLQRLKTLGFNTIYPVVWQRGYTLYPSPIAESTIGTPVLPGGVFGDRDMLSELVQVGKPLGFRIIPWLEYGLMVPPQAELAMRHPDWLSLNAEGSPRRVNRINHQPDPNVWLNPVHPDVQQFMTELIVDLVQRYAVDGIQLDDHFGLPSGLGDDSLTQARYQQQQGRSLPANPEDSQRHRWLMAQMTQLLQQITQRVKQQRSNCIISLSPNPLAFSKRHYHADWQQWQQEDLIDELVLQVYRDQLTSFSDELSKPEVQTANRRIPVLVGILTGLRTRSIPSKLIAEQVQIVRKKRFAGISCFFYETLFHETLSPTKVERSPLELKQMFEAE